MVAGRGRRGCPSGRAYVREEALGSGGCRVCYADSQHPLPRQHGKGDAQTSRTVRLFMFCILRRSRFPAQLVGGF